MTLDEIVEEYISEMERPFTGIYDTNSDCKCEVDSKSICSSTCHFGYIGKCTCGNDCRFDVYSTQKEALAADRSTTRAPVVKTHPLGDLLCKRLFGIENVPIVEQVKMKRRAIKAAMKFYDEKGA